jgi:hypothetical protein
LHLDIIERSGQKEPAFEACPSASFALPSSLDVRPSTPARLGLAAALHPSVAEKPLTGCITVVSLRLFQASWLPHFRLPEELLFAFFR